MKRYRVLPVLLAAMMTVTQNSPTYAMEAPGSGGANWIYSQKDHHWYYYDDAQNMHTGWLKYEGEWYWFDSNGWMTAGTHLDIDGSRYYFYSNGHMAWNQYIGLRYVDADGQYDEAHDIRVIGNETPTVEDRDLITDYLYEVPRTWIDQFTRDGWQFMFYKKKSYFAAPSTDMGIYYVYHSVDTHYRKVKFTDADSILQAFGEYVGYASGCYREGSVWMQRLWNDFPSLRSLLEIPDYYADNERFYFGRLFAAYLDSEKREEMLRNAPGACETLEEILHSRDDAETRARLEAKREAEQKAAEEREARRIAEEGYGPGVTPPETEELAE